MLATMSDSEKTQRAGKDALNFTKAATEALLMPEKGWKYYYDTKVWPSDRHRPERRQDVHFRSESKS